MFGVKDANHLIFVNDEDGCQRDSRRGPDAYGLTCEASFAEKISRAQNRHNRFLANTVDHREFHGPVFECT